MNKWLECQQCGDRVMQLSHEQTQQVARNPYNFVIYCLECKREIVRRLEKEEYGGL